jgi:hypothetical protein
MTPELEADLKAAREILARIRAGEPTIPWEEVKAKLGLDDLPTVRASLASRTKDHRSACELPRPEEVYRFSCAQYELMEEFGILGKYDKVELLEGIVVFKQ